MGCTSATNPVTFGETLSGFLPGMAGCGCGCAGEVSASIAGRMVGMDHHGFVVQPETGFQRNWRATGASSRVSAGGEVGSSENRHAQETADRTNAVLSSGDVALTTEWIEVQQTGDDELIDAWWFEHYHDLGLYYPCSALIPPDRTTWKITPNNCSQDYSGDEATCRACDYVRSEGDFEAMMAASFDEGTFYIIQHAPLDPAAQELFSTAWKLVRYNLDLVRWAQCWVAGSDGITLRPVKGLVERLSGEAQSTASCIIDAFNGHFFGGNSRLVRISFNSDCDFDYQGWFNNVIQICTSTNRGIDSMLTIWNGATSTADLACAVGRVAATLVHEMHHVCGEYNDANRTCTAADLVENAFQWALLRRYPFMGNSKCCTFFYDKSGSPWPFLWGNDEGRSPDSARCR